MKTSGLSLDQAPPLSIPASFFLTIPFGVLASALILMGSGTMALSSPWAPQALALTHALTLGVLAMGMFGALYQMTPVIAGAPVPFTRVAHAVHLLLLAGLTGFYIFLKRYFKASKAEVVQSIFVFLLVAFVVLTIVGVWFRGQGMRLMWL